MQKVAGKASQPAGQGLKSQSGIPRPVTQALEIPCFSDNRADVASAIDELKHALAYPDRGQQQINTHLARASAFRSAS
jgi:hypothetical protein